MAEQDPAAKDAQPEILRLCQQESLGFPLTLGVSFILGRYGGEWLFEHCTEARSGDSGIADEMKARRPRSLGGLRNVSGRSDVVFVSFVAKLFFVLQRGRAMPDDVGRAVEILWKRVDQVPAK